MGEGTAERDWVYTVIRASSLDRYGVGGSSPGPSRWPLVEGRALRCAMPRDSLMPALVAVGRRYLVWMISVQVSGYGLRPRLQR